jgi:hypothetical protein
MIRPNCAEDFYLTCTCCCQKCESIKCAQQDFRRANLLVTRASRYEQSATRLPLHFPSTVKTLTACTPFQRVDVGVVACRRHIRGDGRARIQRAHSRLPLSARELGFAKDCFFACQRAPRANTRANDTRVRLVGSWRSSRARALAHALRACD